MGFGGSENSDGQAGMFAEVANRDSGRPSDKSGPRGGGGTFVIENGGQATLVQPIIPAELTVVTGKNVTDNDG